MIELANSWTGSSLELVAVRVGRDLRAIVSCMCDWIAAKASGSFKCERVESGSAIEVAVKS